MKYHSSFLSKIRKDILLQNLSSTAVVIGALRVNQIMYPGLSRP